MRHNNTYRADISHGDIMLRIIKDDDRDRKRTNAPEQLRLPRTMAAAERGVPKAQRRLGKMYADGDDVEQDYEKAVYWYRRAAEQGDGEAKEAIARLNG